MYNRYLTAAAAEAPPPDSAAPSPVRGGGLAGRLQSLRLDMDAVIALLIVWFLLSDGDSGGVDWEQFLLAGALLLLGA